MVVPLRPPMSRRLDPVLLVATCGGIGWIPVAPGTFGSFPGLPLSLATGAASLWLAAAAGLRGAGWGTALELALIAILVGVGVPVCGRAARLLGSHDPGPVVFDELVAIPLVLAVVPPGARSLPVLGAAFLLFRLFDILKPPPCRQLERLPGGLGIVADDLGAAVLAGACLAAARWQGWL